jgi:hypothetical protein
MLATSSDFVKSTMQTNPDHIYKLMDCSFSGVLCSSCDWRQMFQSTARGLTYLTCLGSHPCPALVLFISLCASET